MAAMGPMGAPIPDPSMMGAMDAMGGMGMMGAPEQAPMPADENEMIMQLLEALLSKWQGGEDQIAGEKSGLLQMLMMMVGAQPPHPQDLVEPMDPMGQDDIPGMMDTNSADDTMGYA